MIGIGNGFVVWAEQYVPSGLTAVVLATSPFWMVAVEAPLRGGESLTRGTISGLLVGFGGILLLVWPDLQTGGAGAARFGMGLIALQLACAGWALGSAWSKRHGTDDNVFGATAVQMFLGGVLMLALGTALGEWRCALVFHANDGRARLPDRGGINRRFRSLHLRAAAPAGVHGLALRLHQPRHRGDTRRAGAG